MEQKNLRINEDLDCIWKVDFIPWELLRRKTIFITGATGLIGSSLIWTLAVCDEKLGLGIRLIALVRDEIRANDVFRELIDQGRLLLITGNVENLPEIQESVDYIIHGASQTASKAFTQHPAETIRTSVLGTMNLLNVAKEKSVQGFVYLSSMEVYGYPERGHKVKEEEIGVLSPLDLRNSYPIGKQLCEAMCCAYAAEYGVSAKIARLTQTFGPGVNYTDSRVFAYFARCVMEKQDIVLKTKGETERCYLYIADAITAILLILLKGQKGQAYNVANDNTYCSIKEMAEKVAADGKIQVKYEIEDEANEGFLKTLYMDLDTTRLKQLGWRSNKTISIDEMYRRMIVSFRINSL